MSYLRRTFDFTSFEQAQHFCQNVGKYCSLKDHHPEWSLTNGGKSVEVRLTSHFAGNKATLFDFELAEHMNEQAKISLKEFRMYPYINDKQWTSIKIFLLAFIGGTIALNLVLNFEDLYNPPTKTRMAFKPYSTQIRPIFETPFFFAPGTMFTDKDAEVWAAANVDNYAFKKKIFTPRSAF